MGCPVKNVIMEASLAVFYMGVDHANQNYSTFIIIQPQPQNMRDAVSRQQVDENTFEWNNVAYKLQSMTGKSSLKMVKLFKYPKKAQQQKYNSKEKLDSLIDLTDYKAEYKNKIINQVIPLEDVLFFCGHVNLKKYHQEPNKIFNFLMCKVVLGKIGKFNEAGSSVDSLFIPSEHQAEPYHFNFLLNQHSQYEVKYDISFVIGDQHENKIKEAICSICERNIATAYCRDELMNFCDDCCDNHHNQIRLAHEDEYRRRLAGNKSNFEPNKSSYNLSNTSNASNRKQNASASLLTVPPIPPHSLQKLSLIHTLPLCQNHSIKNEYYCLKCQKYVCNICIQKGTHNQNPEHVIKHIEYLYSEKSEANNTISTRLKQKLQHLLESIEAISTSVTQNYQQVKRKLTKEFQEALNKLDELYLQKISLVYSDQIQLNMLYQKLEWQKAFILHQEKHLKPINYFKLQTRYESQINSLRISGYDEAFSIKPDLDCYIEWKVGYKNEVLLEKTKRSKDTDANTYPAFAPQVDKKYPPSSAIYQFDSKSQAPKKGDLSLLLEKGNFHIFKFKPSGHQTQ